MKIGITGATGQLGRLVVEKLKKRLAAEDLIALVRTPEKAADMGVEVRPFDYSKPATLAGALQGIDYLLLISASEVGKREKQHENVIRAAQQAGIGWIVYTSLLHADRSSLSLAPEHLVTEQLLKSTGIPYTFLRNGWYTENYTGSVPAAIESGAFVGSAGDGKISSATREDFAEAAAVVLSSEGHRGNVYELAGDEAYTLKELAGEVSRVAGKNIPYKNLTEEEYASALTSMGIPAGTAQAIAGWDVGASRGDLFDNSGALSKLIGRRTTSLTDAVKKALASRTA